MELRAEGTEATWAPEVGMVGCSFRVGGDELLGQRGGLEKYRRSGSTFGIPLLYPWANRLDRGIDHPLVRRDANGVPMHGLLNASPRWRYQGSSKRIVGRLVFDGDLLEVFPHPHVVEVEVDLAPRTLTVATRVHPSDTSVPISFGWHPYVQIPGVPRDEWELTLPVRERLLLDDRMIPTGESEPVDYERPLRLGDRTFDDGYAGVQEGARFAVSGGGRGVEVEFTSGYPYAQVFAPPGQELVCFEPMTAPTNALESGDGLREVAPGQSFEAVFTIRAMP